MILTVSNLTSSSVVVGGRIGTLTPRASRTISLTGYDLDLSADNLSSLLSSGAISVSTAEDPKRNDNTELLTVAMIPVAPDYPAMLSAVGANVGSDGTLTVTFDAEDLTSWQEDLETIENWEYYCYAPAIGPLVPTGSTVDGNQVILAFVGSQLIEALSHIDFLPSEDSVDFTPGA